MQGNAVSIKASDPGKRFLVVLVAMTMVGPLAMQMFIPALPLIQSSFHASAAEAQLVLSLSMLAIAFANLIHGPASDRFGRRRTLLIGMGLFFIGSIFCAYAPTLDLLILGRIIQAIGGGAGMVVGRAIVHDLYGKDRSAEMLAYLTMFMVIAPMIAPSIGGFLSDYYGWRMAFLLTTVAGFAVFLSIYLCIPETNLQPTAMPSPFMMVKDFGALLKIRNFQGYIAQSTFSTGTFFSFIAGAPYFMVDILERPATDYGLYFILIALGFMLGNWISARFSNQYGHDRMIMLGTLLSIFCVTLGFALMVFLPWSAALLFLPMSFAAFANGLSLPNAMAGAIETVPDHKGTASGLMGFAQMIGGAIMAQWVGFFLQDTPYPMLGIMLFNAMGAMIVFYALIWRYRNAP